MKSKTPKNTHEVKNENKKYFTVSNFIYFIIIIIIISIYIKRTIQRKNKEISDLQIKALNLSEIIYNKDKKIDVLNEIIISKNEEINKLYEKLSLKDKTINELQPNDLQKKLEDLNNINVQSKNKIKKYYEEIKNYTSKIKELEEDNNNLRNKITEISKQNEEIKNDKLSLEKNIKSIDIKNEEIRNKDNIILNLKNKKKKKKDELKIYKENSDKSSKYQDEKSENFYDLIIKINSIYGLAHGWEVLMNENGKKNYYEYKDKIVTKIGVIGSENRGKSTILSDLSQIDLPTGYSIKTEGLSIKFPELKGFENRKIILLDSAGLETPILNINSTISCLNNNEIKEDINKINEKKLNGENENENEENNKFAIKSRDIIQLELFLQNYIIKYSDVIILILGKLSINEQKLLIKVKTHIKNLNKKNPLIVIHNLKEFETIRQVEDYFKNILELSSTFTLEEGRNINLQKNEDEYKFFYEKKSEPKIFHIIYGKKGSELGNFYNKKTIQFIYDRINEITDKESFDPIKSIINYFTEISEIILENPIKQGSLIDNLQSDSENGQPKKIMLKDPNTQIILKKCLIDELGLSNFQSNGLQIPYSYYITYDSVIIFIELPGKSEKSEDDTQYENIKAVLSYEDNFAIIKIYGKKKNNIESIMKETIKSFQHKRQFGDFLIQIKLYKISLEEKPLKEIKNGVLLLRYKIKKEEVIIDI